MKNAVWICLLIGIAAVSAANGKTAAPTDNKVRLTSLKPVYFLHPHDRTVISRRAKEVPDNLNDQRYSFGLSIPDNSEIVYVLNSKYQKFDALLGLDSQKPAEPNTSAIFQVFADGNIIFDSGLIKAKTPAKPISLNVAGINELQLKSVNGGSGRVLHAYWAEPTLTPVSKNKKVSKAAAKYSVSSGGISLKFDKFGNIVELSSGDNSLTPLTAGTRLVNCVPVGQVKVKKLENGALAFTRKLQDLNKNHCTVTDRFTPTKDSIRWDVDIENDGKPWSTSIITSLRWPVSKTTQFWTAWSSPDMKGLVGGPPWGIKGPKDELWQDPLETRPFTDSSRWYGGNPSVGSSVTGDYFSIPIYTIIEPASRRGFSLVQSPEDTLLQMKLVTTDDGTVEYQRRWHRLGANNRVHFSIDLICHEDDWRSGMAWMAAKYPEYFEPVNKKAYEIGELGAYTSWEKELDAEKFRKMGFRFNWKASYDFPYMGMFIPPVEQWQTFASPSEAAVDPGARKENKGSITSTKILNDYSVLMKQYGLHVLNYFNVTEFGTKVKEPLPQQTNLSEIDLWKDSSDFLYHKLSDSIMLNPSGKFYRTWGQAIIMDCGAPAYQSFLLEQAKRHIDLLPDSSGICIDRMDWLRLFNLRADDGVTFYDGKTARSLLVSWKQLMDKMGPMMHNSGKVIFANPYSNMRLDILKHIDGIYSEHNEVGPALNASGLLGIKMPVTAWTFNEDTLQPDPDFFFQSLLYMGVFPTAPLPYNNHTIVPGEFADKWYLDYGPLFNALIGRKWVLEPKVIRAVNTDARVNLFEVPAGYAACIMLASDQNSSVKVELNCPELFSSADVFTAEVVHPGKDNTFPISIIENGEQLMLDVPLERKCAIVVLRKKI